MSIASCAVRAPAIYRFNRRPNSSWSSTSGPLTRSVGLIGREGRRDHRVPDHIKADRARGLLPLGERRTHKVVGEGFGGPAVGMTVAATHVQQAVDVDAAEGRDLLGTQRPELDLACEDLPSEPSSPSFRPLVFCEKLPRDDGASGCRLCGA